MPPDPENDENAAHESETDSPYLSDDPLDDGSLEWYSPADETDETKEADETDETKEEEDLDWLVTGRRPDNICVRPPEDTGPDDGPDNITDWLDYDSE
jgi:hypothetical protein